MKNALIFLAFSISMFLLGFVSTGICAQGLELKQRLTDFPTEVLSTISNIEKKAPDNLGKIADDLFSRTLEDVVKQAQSAGFSPEVTENTIIIAGEKMRVDTTGTEGKTTHLVLLDEGKIYNITWAKKQYMEFSIDQIKKMQAQAQEAIKKLQSKGALEKLPPEVRAQMEANMGLQAAGSGKLEVKKTGQSRNIYGFDCEEYRANSPTLMAQAWITQKYPELRTFHDTFMQEFPQLEFPQITDKNDLMRAMPEGWPVLLKTLTLDPFARQPSYEILETLSVTETDVSPETFTVPAGFTKVAIPRQ